MGQNLGHKPQALNVCALNKAIPGAEAQDDQVEGIFPWCEWLIPLSTGSAERLRVSIS
jgi:hypothetical protein